MHVCMTPWARILHCTCVHDSLGQDTSLCMCAGLPGPGYLTVHVCRTPWARIPHSAVCMTPWARIPHSACVHDSLGQDTSLCMCAGLPGPGYLTVHVCRTPWARIPHSAVCMTPWARIPHSACVHDPLGQDTSQCMCA